MRSTMDIVSFAGGKSGHCLFASFNIFSLQDLSSMNRRISRKVQAAPFSLASKRVPKIL
jgi:hypothetical protein